MIAEPEPLQEVSRRVSSPAISDPKSKSNLQNKQGSIGTVSLARRPGGAVARCFKTNSRQRKQRILGEDEWKTAVRPDGLMIIDSNLFLSKRSDLQDLWLP